MWDNSYLVTKEALTTFAWSAPMRDLAARIGISDVGLKKLLRAHGVVTPPQGHWNRVHAGRRVIAPPKAAPRRPGETGRIRLDARFAAHVPASEPWPVEGPFASADVPEDLEILCDRVLAVTRRVSVTRTLERPHAGLVDLLKREARRAEKLAGNSWHWDAPLFTAPYWQRQLRFWDALFRGLDRWGTGSVREDQRRLAAAVTIGDTHVRVELAPLGRVPLERAGGETRPAADTPARTPLRLTIGTRERPIAWFDDDAGGALEKKLREIVAALVMAGEQRFREGLREQREWLELCARRQEEARQRQRAAEEQARAERLSVHAAALREADDIRALVARVRGDAGAVDAAGFAAWSAWALDRADRLDPVRSGVVWEEFGPGQDRT